jgi:uncharacterized protein (TIGR00290 family)
MKSFLAWSGGKDSALCLYKAQQEGLNVQALVTTVSESTDRITMHGVRRELLQQQAASLRLPLHIIELPASTGMNVYEEAISKKNEELKAQGFTHAISGDLFLEDLRTYREGLYAKDGIECSFPLWQIDTKELLHQFIAIGFKAIVVCVNTAYLDKNFCGRLLDESFINDLPANVDVCGENGEYHSFVFDGPNFSQPIAFKKGEIVYQEYPAPKTDDCFTQPKPANGFYFCDLLPVE